MRSLVAEGHLHAPDPSWVLRAMALVHAAGASERLAVELVAALLAAACVPAAFALATRWDLGRTAAWLLAGWAAGSAVLTHLAADFPKNLGVAAPWLLLLALAPRPGEAGALLRPGRLLATLVLAALTAGAHRTGLLLASAWLLALAAALRGGAAPAPPGPARAARVAIALGVLAVGLVAAGLLLRGGLDRASDQLSALPAFPPPPWPYLALRSPPWVERAELVLAWPASVAAALRWWRAPSQRPLHAALLLVLGAALFPFWRADVLDLGWRLALLAPLAAAPALTAWAPRRGAWLALGAAFALLSLAPHGVDRGAAPPWERYRALVAALPRPLPALVIAHQGLASLYDFDTGAEALPWAPEPELDRRTLFRVAFDVRDGEWLAYLPQQTDAPPPRPLGQGAVWLREDLWEAFVQRASAAGDDELRARLTGWRNPSRVRPSWLRAGR